MNEYRLSACHGKDRLTWAVAKDLAKPKHNRGRGRLQAYRCRVCGHWHVGTPLRKNRKLRAVR